MSKGVAVNQRGSGQRALENVADSSPSSAKDAFDRLENSVITAYRANSALTKVHAVK
jgi:hypothetical protein